MSIRADFQSDVDEFIANLDSFASGDYLKPEEKENWEQPFNPQVLPELRNILEHLLAALDELPDDPPGPALSAVVSRYLGKIESFNQSHDGAVVEEEEKADLRDIIFGAAGATGADDEALAQLPEFS